MGLITEPEKPGQYYNVRKGHLTYRDTEGKEQRAYGYIGTFHGIHTRVDQQYGHLIIDVYFHDPRDRLLIIVSGTLYTEEAGWTTYGRMLLQHCADPSFETMRGEEVKLSVWGRKGQQGAIVNCVRLRDPETNADLPCISTEGMSREEIRALCPAWLKMALERVAVPGKQNALPTPSFQQTEEPASDRADDLPF